MKGCLTSRAQLASRLESATPIEVTRHGRTIGLYVPLPQQGDLEPWTHKQDYWVEKDELPAADLDDGTLVYTR